jgi:hypothetical protein
MFIWYCFVVIWFIFSPCGMFYQEKSGNPRPKASHGGALVKMKSTNNSYCVEKMFY